MCEQDNIVDMEKDSDGRPYLWCSRCNTKLLYFPGNYGEAYHKMRSKECIIK